MNEISNAPLSEQFRIAAKRWLDLDAAANILEDTKSAIFSQKVSALGDMPVSRAEHIIKASPEWSAHLYKIAEARKKASEARINLDYIKMRFSEQISYEATARVEAKL